MYAIAYYILVVGIIACYLALRADMRRRRLALSRGSGWSFLIVLDITFTALFIGTAAALLASLIPVAISQAVIPLRSPLTFGFVFSSIASIFLWKEGLRQVQFQRPQGLLLAEALILASAGMLLVSLFFRGHPAVPKSLSVAIFALPAIAMGCAVIAKVVPPFIKKGAEYHRILDHLNSSGEQVQTEYTPPSPECPNPQFWSMVDSQSTELEVLDFLKSLVTTLKPRLVVETGTFLGYGAIALAEGLRTNGFGKLITVEFDPSLLAKAQERINAAGLAKWIECRNESSLDSVIEGQIDLYFCDSALAIREKEIRRLLPQVDPRGLIAIHDASSHFAVVRDAALRMEKDGLLSVVLLSTPRGLVLAQRREGRK